MISTRAKPARRTTPQSRGGEASREVRHDPAGLSATLRELAVIAHHAVRAAERSATSPEGVVGLAPDSHQELVEVHSRIVQLQRSLHAQSIDGLLPYVTALREKVSSVLGH